MLKKITQILFLLILSFAFLQAQSLKLTTYGVTERDVEADETNYFDVPYNGLQNVGINSKVYLKASLDSAFANPSWTLPTIPEGSNTVLGEILVIDEMTQIISLVPDVKGNYIVEFAQGNDDILTINIHAATFVGIAGGSIGCATCHSDVTALWEETGHSTTLSEQLKGEMGDHFNASCVSCHSTGYDTNADNDGFDDRDFVFPDTLSQEAYDLVLQNSPEAMKLSDVQCESCHGPASEHMGTPSNLEVVSSLSPDNCAVCHDSGVHNVLPTQWDVSRHANPLFAGYAGNRSGCSSCHSGSGFIASIKGNSEVPPATAITCVACHDPHDATNAHQLRAADVSLANGFVVDSGGSSKLCMTCHKTRRDGVDYTTNYLNNLSSHYGPHYGSQADLYIGENFNTFDQELSKTNHPALLSNGCVDCHMKVTENVDSEGNVVLVGGHTFSMKTPDGVDNVSSCAPCHSFESFESVEIEVDGTKDLDGDGTEEGLQTEVKGLLEAISLLIPPLDSPEINTIDSTWSQTQAIAYYNYKAAKDDGSYGMHNPKYIVGLLQVSLAELVNAVGVEKTDMLPKTYSLEQNYPNPFNPTTVINFSIPKEGNVKLAIYDALGREVEMLVDKKMDAGNYNADWNAANYAAGIYFYTIQVNNFVSTKKMVLLK